jgi:hypothetical protein
MAQHAVDTDFGSASSSRVWGLRPSISAIAPGLIAAGDCGWALARA